MECLCSETEHRVRYISVQLDQLIVCIECDRELVTGGQIDIPATTR